MYTRKKAFFAKMQVVDLDKFFRKHGIKLNKKTLKLCRQALIIMQKSRDKLHDNGHVLRMTKFLARILNKNPKMLKRKDLETVILSIFWHDSWKALKHRTNPLVLFVNDLYEGLGSAYLFKKNALKAKLRQTTIDRVVYAIRKHSNVNFLPTRTLEAQILQDLDEIEFWNFRRILKRNTALEKLRLFKFFRRQFYYLRSKRRLYIASFETYFKKQKTNLLRNI